MAEGQNTDINLKCTICLSLYMDPRILPCYHIFCTPCLEKLTTECESVYMVCPLCRTEFNLPDGGIKGFELYPFNTKLQNQEPNENGCCQLCSEECFATAKCLECQINLCSNCSDYHGKLKASLGHKLELFHLNQENIVRDDSKLEKDCTEHKLELSQFCQTCNKLICTNCLEKYHTSHKTEIGISSAKLKRQILFTRIASLKSRIPIFENTIEVVKINESSNYKSSNRVKKELRSHAAGLKEVFCRIIDVLLMENLDRVDDISKKDMKCIRTYIDELENEKLSLLCFTNTVEKFVSKYTDLEILQNYLDVGQTIDKVLEKTITGKVDIHEFNYECGNFNEELIKSVFGKLTDKVVSGAIVPSFRFLPVPALQGNMQGMIGFEEKTETMTVM